MLPELVQPFPTALVDLPIEDPLAEIAAIEKELQRRAWLEDPDLWCRQRLGVSLWSKQRDIMRAVQKYRKTLAMSCHDIGKSYSAALIACWWIDCHPPGSAFVLTTAPSSPQVEAILWREMRELHSKGKLAGRMNQTEWYLTINGKDQLVAIGRKPDDYNPTAFHGFHARFVLVIIDEGCGIGNALWDAVDTLITNDESKIFTIGNPDDPATEFFKHATPGSGWHVVQVGAFDSPNFSGERVSSDAQTDREIKHELIGSHWVEEKRKKWAPNWIWVDATGAPTNPDQGIRCIPPEGQKPEDTNPFWQSKILGLFPARGNVFGLIPIPWIEAAQKRTIAPSNPHELGQDVGGGGDSSTIAERQGGVVRIVNEDHNPDTMQTCGLLIETLKTTKATRAKVDVIGIGRGVVDRGKELSLTDDVLKTLETPIVGVSVGEAGWPASAFDIEEGMDPEGFVNLRAQLYWWLRVQFEKGIIDIDDVDDDLATELVEIRFKRLSSGKIQIESKIEAKRRGVRSPNRAEAVMLSYAPKPPEDEPGLTRLTW